MNKFLKDLNKWANETLTVEGEDFVNGIIAGQPWKPEQASAVGTSLGAIIALLKAQGLSDNKIAEILKNGNAKSWWITVKLVTHNNSNALNINLLK